MSRRNWSRQETLMELAFYPRPPLPRKNWDDDGAEIKLLAGEIERTESVVCFKIACLKACDPNRTGLGFTNTAGMGRQVISEYLADPDATMSEAIWSPSRSGFESPTMEKSRPQVLLVPTSHSGSDLSMSSRFARASTRITSAVCFSPTTGHLLPRRHRHSHPAHGEPHQAVGGGHAERAPHVVERPFAKRAARPRFRPWSHNAR